MENQQETIDQQAARIEELEDMLQNLARVPQTGQTICYDTNGNIIQCAGTGQDGEYQYGTPWPEPRFTDNLDGTVTDHLTGLIWLKDANCFAAIYWAPALTGCNSLNSGECGLDDGSLEGDWRLPNARELHSLIDYGNTHPALPTGHPFINVSSNWYWSSTTDVNATYSAWYVRMGDGHVGAQGKDGNLNVWPVRDGN